LILTLTVNPAIDRNLTVDRLVFEDRAYILSTEEGPGGRGFNASRVIHSFGGKTMAVSPVGGESGERLRAYYLQCGFPMEIVAIQAESRVNLAITDQQGLTVKLNERGPRITPEELAGIDEAVRRNLDKALWLMLCGSLPPGVTASFYSNLVEAARLKNVKVLLDTDGDALEAGLEAKPTIVAPNQQEAERLLNRALITRGHFLDAAERIRLMGADGVVLSLGSRGAVGALDGTRLEAVPPRIDAVCPIGSGDALAASFVWAMSRKNDFADALRWGVAAGTASAKLPGVTFATLAQTQEVYRLVELRRVD
jgi:1-phosphofructokinase family hexose kinase